MNQRKLSVLLKYEFLNTLGNFFTPFFGIIFPIVMGVLIVNGAVNGVPASQKVETGTAIVLVIALIIPSAMMLISFSAVFSQETEQGVIRRLELFNFSDRNLMLAKVIVHYMLITFSLILYTIVMSQFVELLQPTLSSVFIYLFCFYLLATLLFIFSYAVTTILKKFGTTYSVTMIVYFAYMGLSGMMGPQVDQLPKIGQRIAYSFPMAYISRDFSQYWENGFKGYNFAPLIQSFIFMSALVVLIYLFSRYKNRRRLV